MSEKQQLLFFCCTVINDKSEGDLLVERDLEMVGSFYKFTAYCALR